MFTGFSEETIRFFLELRLHNETSFFHAHQEEYKRYVREPFYAFISELAPAALAVAGDMETRPDKCLSRINRDTRFSNDKSPYRDHLWFLFRRGGGESKDRSVMYWFEMGADRLEWGLGFWGRNQPAMEALRRMMRVKPREVSGAFRRARVPDAELQVRGERYLRMKPPDGLPIALAALYPLKEIYIQRAEPPFHLCYSPQLKDMVAQDFLRMKPLYELFRAAADEGAARLDG